MKPENIDEKASLFVDGLGLDSIDALELTVLLEKKYGLKINTAEEGKKVLYSVRSMAEFITANNKS
jgi:acyl carrier protein